MPRNSLKDLLQYLPFDISVEALAAWMVENGQEVSGSGQVLVRPLGHNGRTVAREVQGVAGAAFNADGRELFYLDINREGLFDSLPEMLFIRLPEEEDELEKVRELTEQKEAARRFFLPLEEVLYQTRIEAELAERAVVRGIATRLLDFFGVEAPIKQEEGQLEQMLSFALALPLTDRIVGNLDYIQNLLETVLRKNVTINPGPPPVYPIPEDRQSRLGTALLGVDLVTGSTFSDGIRALDVTVYDISPEEVEDWLPGGNLRQMVEGQLLPRLLAVGENIQVSIEISGTDGELILGKDQIGSTLGFTTILF